jgi:preprotein translocase subunit SecB
MKRKSTEATSQLSEANYEGFLKSVKPIGLGLVENSSRLDRRRYSQLMGQRNRPGRTISTEYKLVKAGTGYFDTSAKFLLVVVEEKKDNPALLIQCVYEAHFHCNESFAKDFAERFASSELRLLIWPYFRAFVSDLCGKMSIPPILIPLSTTTDE